MKWYKLVNTRSRQQIVLDKLDYNIFLPNKFDSEIKNVVSKANFDQSHRQVRYKHPQLNLANDADQFEMYDIYDL